jgi:3-hydroxyisobutyrate dehydrogenase-like beta-hydroxyacid dehydrogenase
LLSASDSVRPSLLIDASTVDPQTCRRLAKRVADCKLSSNSKKIGAEQQAPLLLDAPVSGGVVGAQAATLTFMVGGSEEALKGAQHLLKAMGTRVVHCGGAGNGAVSLYLSFLSAVTFLSQIVLGYRLERHIVARCITVKRN